MFKHSKNFKYDIKGSRSENCVLINTENWYVNDSNVIVEFNSRGGVSNTFITEVLAENLSGDYKGKIGAGDVILITAVAAKLYSARPFSIPIDFDSTKYTDVPYQHVIGKFEKKISFNSLHLLGDFLLLERLKDVDVRENGFCITTNYTNSVYKVVKKADSVDVADVILVKDNVATPIMLDGIQYYAVSFKDVVAGFDVNAGEYTVGTISTVYNHFMICEDCQTQYANEGSTIFKAGYDLEEQEWLSESYNENRFKVILSMLDGIDATDIIYAIREAFEYCTFDGVQYYVVNNKKFILAKLREN